MNRRSFGKLVASAFVAPAAIAVLPKKKEQGRSFIYCQAWRRDIPEGAFMNDGKVAGIVSSDVKRGQNYWLQTKGPAKVKIG